MQLRKAREMTQAQIASALDATQSNVSQIEKRDDLNVSTLRRYIHALGGHLELVAVFPDGASKLRVAEVTK